MPAQFQPPQFQSNPAMALANVGEILGALVASGPQGAQQAASRIDARNEGARQRAWNAFTRMQDMQFQAAQKQMDRNHDAAMRRMDHALTKGDEINQAAGQLAAKFLASPAQFETFKSVNPGLGVDANAPANVWALRAAQSLGPRGAIATFDGMATRTEAEAELASMGVTVEPGQDPQTIRAEITRRQGPAVNLLEEHEARLGSIDERLNAARQSGASPEEMKQLVASLSTELAGWQDRFTSLGTTYNEFYEPGGMGDRQGLPGKFASVAARAATVAGALGFVDDTNLKRAAVGTNPRELRLTSPLFAPDIVASEGLRAEAVSEYSAAHGEAFNTQLRNLATQSEDTLIGVFGEEVYRQTIKPLIDGGKDFNQLISDAMALQGSGTQAGEAAATIGLISRFANVGDRNAEIARYHAIENQVENQTAQFENELGLLGLAVDELGALDLDTAIRSSIDYDPSNGATVRKGGLFIDDDVLNNVFGAVLENEWSARSLEDPVGAAAALATRIRSLGNTPLGNGLRRKANELFKSRFMGTGMPMELHPDLAEFYLRTDAGPVAYGNSEQLGRRAEDIFSALTSPSVPSFLTMTGEDADAFLTWQGVSDRLKGGKLAHIATKRLKRVDDDVKSPLVRGNLLAGAYNAYRPQLQELRPLDQMPERLRKQMAEHANLSEADFADEYGRLIDGIRLKRFLDLRLEPGNPLYSVQKRLNEMPPRDVYNTVIAGQGMPLGDLFPNNGEVPYESLGFGPSVDFAYEAEAYGATTRGAADITSLRNLGNDIAADLDRRRSLISTEGSPGFEPVINIDLAVGPDIELRRLDSQAIEQAERETVRRLEKIQAEEMVIADQTGVRGALDRGMIFGVLQYAADHPVLDLGGREEFAKQIYTQIESVGGKSLVPGIEKGAALLPALEDELKNATDGEATIRGMFRGTSLMLGQLIADSQAMPQSGPRAATISASKAAFDRSIRDIEALAMDDRILTLKMGDIADPTILAELEQVDWDGLRNGTSDEEIANARWYKAAILWAATSKAAYAREQ
jgi:hypothetical protein